MPTMTTPTMNLCGRESFDPYKGHTGYDIHLEKVGRVLMSRYSSTPRGLHLVKRNGVWEALGSAIQAELEAAEEYYLGGHRHEVTLEIGRELVDAGMVTENLDDPIIDPITDEIAQVTFEGIPDWRPPEQLEEEG